MRKSTILLSIVASLAFANASAQVNAIKVVPCTGEPVILALSEEPSVTWETEEVSISTSNETIQFNLTEILSILPASISSISQIEKDDIFAFVIGDTLQAYGMHPGELLNLFSLEGHLIGSTKANSNGEATLELADYNGIMIITTSSHSIKIKR